MRRNPRFPRGPRGAAAVEMSISMLIFVPVFLYALFLDDLLRYSLDAQETALSTVWDFTVQDYAIRQLPVEMKSPGGGNTRVQKQARHMFCDHESGIDSFQQKTYQGADGKTYQNLPDCEETDHHKALAAHVCWINSQAKQVTCEKAEAMAASVGDGLQRTFQAEFTRGGLIRCEARAVVENYLLPEQFLSQFAKEELVNKQWEGEGDEIHQNSKKGTLQNAYFLKKQQLAILTDTWALTRPEDVRPGAAASEEKSEDRTNPPNPPRKLREMVEHVYQKNNGFTGPGGVGKTANEFLSQASNAELLDGSKPDDPTKPNLAISPYRGAPPTEKIKQESGNASYFNTEWEDWERNQTPKTAERRHAGYLGCAPNVGC